MTGRSSAAIDPQVLKDPAGVETLSTFKPKVTLLARVVAAAKRVPGHVQAKQIGATITGFKKKDLPRYEEVVDKVLVEYTASYHPKIGQTTRRQW
ncbi:hypothetical protein MMC28_006806 [Mycoblastus sanguinarius]|nr:hypothetical protein [Mycoblastus sanguinarius]